MTRHHKKFRKSVWIPLALVVYAAAISIYFGPDMIASGRKIQFWLSVAFEIAVISEAFLFIRKREKMQKRMP